MATAFANASTTGDEPLGERPSPPGFRLAPGRRLRLRWLGRVAYRDAHALQRGLWAAGPGADDWLLLLEHPSVFTAGIRAKAEHMLVDPASVGAELLWVDRGGDITYHGPGQLVGYPVLSVPSGPGATPGYVHEVEQLVIEVLEGFGLRGVGRLDGYPGVWVGASGAGPERRTSSSKPRKICAIGARHSRQRTMHGFALNVDVDLSMFGRIVPCGISGFGVTSLAAEGVPVPMREVVEAVFAAAEGRWGANRPVERQDVAWRVSSPVPPQTPAEITARPLNASEVTPSGGQPAPLASRPVRLAGKLARLAEAGADPSQALALDAHKPSWLRAKAHMGAEFGSMKKAVRGLSLVTVCEEAGCPNIFECWAEGTATFMINGDRCTRACGFCQVSTHKPLPLDPGEPERVAEAVRRLGLAHAVVTCVARDDLSDGGASAFAATLDAIRRHRPGTSVEVLISDCKGDPAALRTIFERRPDVLNHNVETVPRLQRAVRPSASYARSLAVLALARDAGLLTKSGLMVGLGEEKDEVLGVLADLHGVGVAIVTIGQYLRPSEAHLPVARWWSPEELAELARAGEALGITHVEASPFTRSSYHARSAAAAARQARSSAPHGVGGQVA
jgi:lipoic acid synthetase